MMSQPDAMAAIIAKVRGRFDAALDDRIATLEAALTGAPDTDALTEVRVVLHQIAGSAGSVGQQELGVSARNCEYAIDGFFSQGVPAWPELRDDIRNFTIQARRARQPG